MASQHTRKFIQRGAFVLLGLILAELWTRETPSMEDPDVRISTNFIVSPGSVFSSTYAEARSKFRSAAINSSAELYTFSVCDNEEYTMDIAIVKGKRAGTVVHTSGYHGVEGFAGSAIQIAWLQQDLSLQLENLPTVILVHAVNPYGMATYRRTNENNVDLNRNGLHPDELKVALQRDPNIGNYQDFDTTLLNPRRPPTAVDRYLRIYVIAGYAILRHGLVTLKRAMVSGQYHFTQGIFYGGQELQPSLKILWDFLEKHVPKRKRVTMVNVHTGLGPSGYDSILTSSGANISPEALKETFCNSSIPSLSQSASDVTAGYNLAMGTAEDFFSSLFRKKVDWIVTQEFGTIPMPLVGMALVMENMARQYLPPDEAMEWTELTRLAFYKQTPKWRKHVLVRGLRVLHQSINRTVS